MFELDVEKVCFIVAKAREYEEQEPGEEDEFDADEPMEHLEEIDDISDAHADEDTDDNTRDEIVAWIDAMTDEEQCQLVALAWIGRGDYTAEEWNEALTVATEEHNNRTAQYLLGMPLLPDYLEEGLAAFDLACD